jgi:NADP-dependent 3-hydroxy acid dehydrogenase YdfG
MSESKRGVAVVSGAGSGIGREIALALGGAGYRLALLGRRQPPLAECLQASGAEGVVLSCDVRDFAAVAEAAERVEAWAPVEVVVPAAGVVTLAPADELSARDFADMVETNLTGAFHLVRAFLPAMKERGAGRLFPVLSVAAKGAFPTWGGYCASKWGLAGLVAALRAELAGTGVLVTALYPGATATPLWDGVPGEWDRSKMVPAAEVARAVVYALETAEPALVEEIHLGPAGGAL